MEVNHLEQILRETSEQKSEILDINEINAILNAFYDMPVSDFILGNKQKPDWEMLNIFMDQYDIPREAAKKMNMQDFMVIFDSFLEESMADPNLDAYPGMTGLDKASCFTHIFLRSFCFAKRKSSLLSDLARIDSMAFLFLAKERAKETENVKDIALWMSRASAILNEKKSEKADEKEFKSLDDYISHWYTEINKDWTPCECIRTYEKKMRDAYEEIYFVLYKPLAAANSRRNTLDAVIDLYSCM